MTNINVNVLDFFWLQVHFWTSSPVAKLEFWNLEEKLVLGCIPLLGLDLLHVASLNMPLNDNNKCSSNISVENLCIMLASTFSVWQKMTDDNDKFHHIFLKWQSCKNICFFAETGQATMHRCVVILHAVWKKRTWVTAGSFPEWGWMLYLLKERGENKWCWWQKCGHH